MNKYKITFLTTILGLLSTAVFSQEVQQQVEMADEMRKSGKIYVVVAVLCIVFLGIVAYLISIDRKVSRLESKMKDNK
jgi:CcmD family protein